MEDVSMSFDHRLANHVFNPSSWIEKANGNAQLARYYQDKVAPMSQFKKSDYCAHFAARLVLLTADEWAMLGFMAAVLPFAASAKNHLNGKLRRAVATRLRPEMIDALAALPPNDCASLLPANAWEDASKVATAGISAIVQTLEWSPAQKAILDLRFEFASPACTHLTLSLVEDLCKISLPNLLWLFPEDPLA